MQEPGAFQGLIDGQVDELVHDYRSEPTPSS
jgi:hypothetical protein